MKNKWASLMLVAAGTSGCDADAPGGDTGNERFESVCGHYEAISDELGCAAPNDGCAEPPKSCEALAHRWLDCVEKDLRQCYCEADDDEMNCEGSFKRDEGPARCVAEYAQLEACLGD